MSDRPVAADRLFMAMIVVVLAAGAATTGTGPHAGGKGSKRIPIGLADMTRIHAEIVIATAVLLLVLLWVLWRSDAPAAVQDLDGCSSGSWSPRGSSATPSTSPTCPPVLVGIHVFGASMVWTATLWFHHGLSGHRHRGGRGRRQPAAAAGAEGRPGGAEDRAGGCGQGRPGRRGQDPAR